MIRAQMAQAGVELNCREQLWSTSLAAVQVHGHRVDWCQIGDCMILLIFRDDRSRLLTRVPAQDEQVLKTWQAIGADEHGSIHQVLAGEIAAVRRQTNRSFGSLNGEDEALDFLAHGSLEDEQISDVLLFTDGFFPPNPDPGKSFDQDKLVRLYRSAGLGEVRDYIRRVQREDPRCHRYPRFKMFDDIGAIALRRT
jgi:serine/threonine protein phosphatase PrpC